MKFEQLGISAPILKVLAEEHYEKPTPIQEKTIPSALEKRDILGLAQTGTGKTAAFSVPTLQILANQDINFDKRKLKALILTPTRELAIQIQESMSTYGKYLPLKSTVIFGGVKQGRQVTALKKGVEILIATPGRLMDLMNQGYVKLNDIEIFILDEADRMLDMGFINDIKKVMAKLPKKKQTMLFSATMPKEIRGITDKLLNNPVEVSVTPVSSTVDTIDQSIIYVDNNNKINVLNKILNEHPSSPFLIFTRTKHGANKVEKDLAKRKFKVEAIHGNKSQNARVRALDKFKNYQLDALVATDIAARGIDINELKYVINFDLPEVPETYVHRIGRSGRAGKEGFAISLCSFQDKPLLKDIEKVIKKQIDVIDNEEYPMEDFTPKAKKKPNNTPRRKPSHKNDKPKVKKAYKIDKNDKKAVAKDERNKEARKEIKRKITDKKKRNKTSDEKVSLSSNKRYKRKDDKTNSSDRNKKFKTKGEKKPRPSKNK
ncbi:DEAD/DEAH box helicase [Mycoplasma sp. P36-A1]|uniref:DEAD/DEAH box helicase n=1 Tax=Mycoplasma sp. P36-A1 TaxID=3252900 RepID=UPI003C2C8FAC